MTAAASCSANSGTYMIGQISHEHFTFVGWISSEELNQVTSLIVSDSDSLLEMVFLVRQELVVR